MGLCKTEAGSSDQELWQAFQNEELVFALHVHWQNRKCLDFSMTIMIWFA